MFGAQVVQSSIKKVSQMQMKEIVNRLSTDPNKKDAYNAGAGQSRNNIGINTGNRTNGNNG